MNTPQPDLASVTRLPPEALRLETERLLLRPFGEEDAPAVLELFSDLDVARYLAFPALTTIEQAVERLRRYAQERQTGSGVRFAIVPAGDDRVVGECGLFRMAAESRRAEIGYVLAPDVWSRGYAGEALVALLAFGFRRLRLNRVEAEIDPRNAASARVLERLGFRREGLLRERWIVAGETSDSGIYGLLEADWRQRPQAREAG